ncbi:hypothetical protein H9P43_002940 [Blastocladiella emersonii ATCC 22665]|nr:hypothetical protein H9P43_002940 [Blastocladiella emersonii ATCC 22665]
MRRGGGGGRASSGSWTLTGTAATLTSSASAGPAAPTGTGTDPLSNGSSSTATGSSPPQAAATDRPAPATATRAWPNADRDRDRDELLDCPAWWGTGNGPGFGAGGGTGAGSGDGGFGPGTGTGGGWHGRRLPFDASDPSTATSALTSRECMGVSTVSLATTAVNQALVGALLLQMAYAACAGAPRGRIGLAMHTAGALLAVSMSLDAWAVPIVGYGRRRGQNLVRMAVAWMQLVAIVLISGVMVRRSLAIRVAMPFAVLAARVLTGAFLVILLTVRVLGTMVEVQSFVDDVSPFARVGSRQVLRTLINCASAVYVLYMETFISSVIFSYREGRHGTAARRRAQQRLRAQQQAGGDPRRPRLARAKSLTQRVRRRARRCWASPTSRLRLLYSVAITFFFLLQAALQLLNLYGLTWFTPFYGFAWTLVLVRQFEFRLELEEQPAAYNLPKIPTTVLVAETAPAVAPGPPVDPLAVAAAASRRRILLSGRLTGTTNSSGASGRTTPHGHRHPPPVGGLGQFNEHLMRSSGTATISTMSSSAHSQCAHDESCCTGTGRAA